jgi:DNA-binding response OmpR family regulator
MKVLLVEDDERLAATLRRGLRAEGITTDTTASGVDGLWMATEGTYDAIVLDLMLPEMNGFQLCAELRRRQIWTPILVLTAKSGELDETESLDTGADDFLSKPFSFQVLVARLRALARRGDRQPAPLQSGDLRLDLGGRRCLRGSVEINLTAREFAVLEFLLRRRSATKLEILYGVWEYAFDGDPNIVEVYVGRLRRKIDAPFDTATIETVRGAGYRLVE